MEPGVSITIKRRVEVNPIKVGDKIKLAKSSRDIFRARLKPREMVYRMLKKKFVPTFIVTAVYSAAPWQFNANMIPYNF